MSVVAGVIAVIVTALLLWHFFPEGTEKWLTRVLIARKLVFGVGLIILSLFLLSTGALGLMLVGGLILLLIVLYLLDDPNGELETYI